MLDKFFILTDSEEIIIRLMCYYSFSQPPYISETHNFKYALNKSR